MSQYNTETTLNSYYKEVLADSIIRLPPEGSKLTKLVPFVENDSPGEKFVQPVHLAHEHGFSVGTGAFSLNSHIAAEQGEAEVDGYSMLLRTAIGYDAADRMTSSKKAFAKWGEVLFTNMKQSMEKRVEVANMYGRTSLGVVSAIDTGVITITTASWAPGIWAGAKGAVIEAFTALTGGSQHNGDLTITAVDLDARTITVSGTSAAVAEGDYLFWKGYRGAEQYGLDYVATNAGELYNIDAATYEMWKGSSYSCGSQRLTMSKLISAAARATERGCEEELVAIISNRTYGNLNADLAALRSYDGSYKAEKGENGVEGITYHSDNGTIKIVPSIYCKQGEGFLLAPKRCKRVGSADVTFNRPGQSEKVFLELPSNAGFELRVRTNQTFFCERPAYLVKLTGIVNE
jgi:hypothetical protein